MQNIDHIYLINMKRSTDRLEHFMTEVSKHQLPLEKLEIFNAIDASVHDLTLDELELTKHLKNELKTVICNFLSHYYIWKDIVEHSYKNALILQDDVYFADGVCTEIDKVVEHMPNDSVIVNIGLHKFAANSLFIEWPVNEPYDTSLYTKEIVNDHICTYSDGINPCSLAYIVNGANASSLFTTFPTISCAIDGFFNAYCVNNRIFYGSRIVLATGNANFKSTVFNGPTFKECQSSYLTFVDDDE